VAAWRRTGQRHSVAVWTTRQLATFLDHVAEDRLFAMWWLIALRGLRRGEAAGLRWVDVDLDPEGRHDRPAAHRLRPHRRRGAVEDRRQPAHRRPKPHHCGAAALPPPAAAGRAAGRRPALARLGQGVHKPDGTALHPDWLTRRFCRLVKDSQLPPVRLHDLRHGAATLAHAAGADLKTVQEQLGHSSIVLTADTYTSVLLELHFKVAEATARLVLKAAARNPGLGYRSKIGPSKSAASDQATRPEPVRPSDPARPGAPTRTAHP
jgi:integrase